MGLSFGSNGTFPPLKEEHITGLFSAASKGHLSALRLVSFSLVRSLDSELLQQRVQDIMINLLCMLPQLESLGFYAIANDKLVTSIVNCKKAGKLPRLKSIDIMECGGIQPDTLKELHIALPEQGIGYFGMGLTNLHAFKLIEAAMIDVGGGIHPMQNVTVFSANGNDFEADGLAGWLAHLPALVYLELSHGDMKGDKFDAIAKVRREGKLQKINHLVLRHPGLRAFSSESLVNLVSAFQNLGILQMPDICFSCHDIKLLAGSAERGTALQQLYMLSLGHKNPANVLGGVCPHILARLLSSLPSLKMLSLEAGLDDEHLAALLPVVQKGKWSKLTKLGLSNNPGLTDLKLLEVFLQTLRSTAPELRTIELEKMSFGGTEWTALLMWAQNIPRSSATGTRLLRPFFLPRSKSY